MKAERHESTALLLIAGMAVGVMLGGPAFPQVAIEFGDTMAGWVLGAAGMVLAGLGYEIVASLSRHG
jgi:hypothetical protein